MIYDIFNINNELDVLELRLNILNNYVDYFIIIESTKTFSGINKPLYYNENKLRYLKFNNKIIHCIINEYPENINDSLVNKLIYNIFKYNTNYRPIYQYGFNEIYQKECAHIICNDICNENDVCYISDIDEIWNPNIMSNINILSDYYKPKLDYSYIEYLNQRNSDKWYDFTGTIASRFHNIKNKPISMLRSINYMKTKYIYIDNGGWHFNAIGGIGKKISDWSHPIYDKYHMLLKQKNVFISENELPKYILDNKNKYSHLFL